MYEEIGPAASGVVRNSVMKLSGYFLMGRFLIKHWFVLEVL